MHCAMIDLGKAFDRVNLNTLISMLKNTQVSYSITELVSLMLRNSFANVLFNGVNGSQWLIGNGARQGEIFPPLLFNFYIIDVIERF